MPLGHLLLKTKAWLPTNQPDSKSSEATQEVLSSTLSPSQAAAVSTPTPTPQQTVVTVVKVVDGDTVDVDINGKTERLRLIGLDTPETVDPRKPVQCFGLEASNKAKELLGGKTVKLEGDPSQGERDKYGRLLRYVYLPDGQLFNKLMIADGYAFEYTYNTSYRYQKDFQDAEKNARENNKGLWSPSACNGEVKAAATSTPKPTPSPTPRATRMPTPTPTKANTPPPAPNCDPNYTPCIPNVSHDLNCGDIGFAVRVIGTDRHRLDGDGDGHGCESYR